MPAKSVLLINEETDEGLQEVLNVVLNHIAGWRAISIASKSPNLSQLLKYPPDLIMFNMRLSNQQGLSFTQKRIIEMIKSSPLTQESPILLLTDQANWFSTEQLRQLGIVGAIAKPFDPITLPTQISHFMHWSTP